MSEQIKHECGIALVRLLKPLEYYYEKYGTWAYGLNKLTLLMEKQHNRGQDGAGLVSLKINQSPGDEYLFRERSNQPNSIIDLFKKIHKACNDVPESFHGEGWKNIPYAGELYLGHLRYGTFGRNNIDYCHPVIRQNNWKSRNLAVAGNFNMTNVDEIFKQLVDLGQHPTNYTDTVTVLENIGHFLDCENEELFSEYKNQGYSNIEISPLIEKNLNIQKILELSSKRWDGGYVIAGVIGHGDAFVTRDPWGIRPAYYYQDEELLVVASERPVIQTALNVSFSEIKELDPGYAIIIKKDGSIDNVMVRTPEKKLSCSFERIYFSRGNDKSIYQERRKLGELMTNQLLNAIDHDIKNTVFSYIPNTAETAFWGLLHGVEKYLNDWKINQILKLKGDTNKETIQDILSISFRADKIAIKDAKMRTFIADDKSRNNMVEHVYDVTYGIVKNQIDNLVILDDSIVRGTTLEKSILNILDRLHPKRIVIASSAPQIRYPDCYGIDMAKLNDFCAFRAAIELLKDEGKAYIIDQVYNKCKKQIGLPKEDIINYVKEIYEPFSPQQISDKISQMLTPPHMNAEVKIIYNTIENLHESCPNDIGDWYFTGNYPTPGGNKVVNTAFINYFEGRNERAY